MLKSIAKIIGGSDERVVRKMQPGIDAINALEPAMERLSDSDLRAKTGELRTRIRKGEDLDDLTAEAFAVVREAARRTLGQRHFDVQLVGGMVLHSGKIAEMRTGEGKTLVATLPAYLNALTGGGVHVITVNDYLARRDAQWMGAIYHMLGLSVGVLQHDSAYLYDPSPGKTEPGMEKLRQAQRREAYAADITYGTNNEFGFDYLRDNMVINALQRVQRELAFAIVDEVDNILIDEARTPLIISGPAEQSPREYQQFARLILNLKRDTDYTIEEKHRAVSLTPEGIAKLERLLKVDNLYAPKLVDLKRLLPESYENLRRQPGITDRELTSDLRIKLLAYIENALKAQAVFQRDQDYVVKDGEVVLVDEFTGRLMPGRRLSDGLHQAIEAKEGVRVRRESITYATITLQNYFRLYDKLAGMTGTAATEAEEFFKIYNLDVVEVPTNQPMVRDDRPDLVYKDEKAKYAAVVKEIEERHRAGQPVLVGTTDIDKSEVLSEMLNRRGVRNEVLNAKQHEREAQIVAEAGRPGAVTVATNMAGRGTDIVLGGNPESLDMDHEQWEKDHDFVVDEGGLFILGTERHEARRIDNQLRGRAGRQGDPGETRFYVALDDELMRRFGGDRIRSVMDWAGLEDDVPIENKMIGRAIEGAQVKVEAYHFDIRKHLVEYDDVVNTHRDVIYGERTKILDGDDLKTNVEPMIEREVQSLLDLYFSNGKWDTEAAEAAVLRAGICYYCWGSWVQMRSQTQDSPDREKSEWLLREIVTITPSLGDVISDPNVLAQLNVDEIKARLLDCARAQYEDREQAFTPEIMRNIERTALLGFTDSNEFGYPRHLTDMQELREGSGLQGYGQRDPLVMYKSKGHQQFQKLRDRIQHGVARTIFHVAVRPEGRGNGGRALGRPRNESPMGQVAGRNKNEPVKGGGAKVGRNEPCPCGSGKKYKRCHGA